LAQEHGLDPDALIHLPAVSEWPDFNDLPSPKSNAALFIFLGLIGLLVFAYFIGKRVAHFLRRSQVSFYRVYRHQ
jgi:hypothetical protein